MRTLLTYYNALSFISGNVAEMYMDTTWNIINIYRYTRTIYHKLLKSYVTDDFLSFKFRGAFTKLLLLKHYED